MRKYVTVQGDMWDGIAKKVYGHERYMNELLKANPFYHRTMIFSADITLDCPDIVIKQANIWPPWRR